MPDEPERRAFDFWVGSWRVTTPDGVLAGHNEIEPILGGAALLERWTGESGLTGTSLNAWDAATGRWRQTWVDSSGTVLLLSGGPIDGAMVLEGELPSSEHPGSMARHRITWTPLPGDAGAVRQHWEASEDGGTTWSTLFDGRYERAP